MSKVTAKDIAAALNAETGMGKGASEVAVNAVFKAIGNKLVDGFSVQIHGFGQFNAVERASRKGRNPQTGAQIEIPAQKTATFSVSKTLKEAMN